MNVSSKRVMPDYAAAPGVGVSPPAAVNVLRSAVDRAVPLLRRAYSKFTRTRFLGTGGTEPLSRDFGFDYGQPIDRQYIETFLAQNCNDIRGRVLEVGDNSYTMRFGAKGVQRSDVLHVMADVPGVTIVDDLNKGDNIPSNAFDCIIVTQTLQFVFDMRLAIAILHRALKPGGVLLITVPGVTSIARDDDWGDTWFWSLTPGALRRLLRESFDGELDMFCFGNVLAASAFLYGVPSDELTSEELAAVDPHYPVIVAARAVKRE